nr:hypothetical protein [Streptomyces albidoflavus]
MRRHRPRQGRRGRRPRRGHGRAALDLQRRHGRLPRLAGRHRRQAGLRPARQEAARAARVTRARISRPGRRRP